jgi:hypothetical protein
MKPHIAQVHQLSVMPTELCLRLPVVVRHTITDDSPLASWRGGQASLAADANSEIVAVVCCLSLRMLAPSLGPYHHID